ncbi:MAG: TatD family hydrolase [Actinomycetota bacterium]
MAFASCRFGGERGGAPVPPHRGGDDRLNAARPRRPAATWFDSHCHLFDCEGSVADLKARARSAGVTEMLVAGTDVATSRRAVELAREPGIYAAAGVHPNEATAWGPPLASSLDQLVDAERVVAVGESGLDFFRAGAPEERQRAAFATHIELAIAHDKALIVHTRASIDAALDMLVAARARPRTVFHCWSGDAAQLERALVETDSPYLSPVPHRGKPNEPAHVVEVGAVVARARGVDPDVVAHLTSTNARRLFGMLG